MRSTNFSSPFLERQQELESLEAHLEATKNGSTRFVAISAEAGAGKSRLAEELRRRHFGGVQFLYGRAFHATYTTPYAVWVDALDFHLRGLRRRDLLHVIGESTDLRRLFPAVSEQFALTADLHSTDDRDWEGTRLFGQMAALLTRLSAMMPTVVVLDNLQWADASSIEMLHAVVRAIQGSSILILALYRNEEVSMDAPLQTCVDSLDRLGFGESLTLAPLSLAATSAIVGEGTGVAWPMDAVRQLHLLTQGNALFIWELVKHSLVMNKGQPFKTAIAQKALPDSIGSLIQERLRELDEDARRVLAFAAAIEANISYPLLQAATSFDEERLLNALDILTGQRFLDEFVNGSDVFYEFHKPLVQATVYQSMGAARRQFLHRVIAAEMMQREGGKGTDAAAIARHLVAGAAEGRQDGALPYLIQAARDAVSIFGNHEAIALLTTALRVALSSPGSGIGLYDLYLNLGESYKRLGNFEHAVEVWKKAIPLGNAPEKASLRRCIARALWQAGDELEAISQMEQGISELALAPRSVEGDFLRQEFALSKARQGDVQGAMDEAVKVLGTADEESEPELLARIHIVICLAQGYRGEMHAAFQAGAKALALAEFLPYPGAAYLAHYTLADLLRYEGDRAIFDSHCSHCSRIASQMHAVALESWPLSIQIESLTLQGRLEEAISLGLRAVDMDEAIAQGTILPRSHAFLAVAYRLAGDASKARKHLVEANRLVTTFRKSEMRCYVVASAATAYVDFLDGKYGAALERVDSLMLHISRFEALSFYALHPYVLPLAAESAARMGSDKRAAEILSLMKKLQKGSFRPAEGSVLHVNGLLLLNSGAPKQARISLESAASFWDRAARPYDAARARVDLADALEQTNEHDLAAEVLGIAANAFNVMAASKDVAMVSQRLRRKGIRATFASQRRVIGQAVSARELDVVGLVATGKTNKEIAGDLFLSELTIETHVRNILRKLGLKSRAQIASYAVGLSAPAIPKATSATVYEHPAAARKRG